MTDIAVIVLIGQEKMHLERCVEKLAVLNPRQIFLVESQPDDGGVVIAKETAARFGLHLESQYHKWPGLYGVQFQWALDNLPIEAQWVLRLDADEYLTDETACTLRSLLATGEVRLPPDVAGITLELKRIIFGGEIRHGTNGIRLLRIFRRGRATIEQRSMDEHMHVQGEVIDLDGAFYDHNLNGFEWWQKKHRGYAVREAQDAVALFSDRDRMSNPSPTDRKKILYYKFPRYIRVLIYFCMRYFLKCGFLDGRAGWRWNFWQGLWYRWLVDREIGRLSAKDGKE